MSRWNITDFGAVGDLRGEDRDAGVGQGHPALANLPAWSWGGTVRGGKLLAAPYAQQTTSTTGFVRRDVFDDRGLPFAPAGGAEFGELCRRELTDERQSH